jgi:N-acetylglutamate synthase-like GNAT family acetyltransferase
VIRCTPEDVVAVRDFLSEADLTLAGLDDPSLRLWMMVDDFGSIVGTTGFELAGSHALIRSVAVRPAARGRGLGLDLARFALEQAHSAGATTAWLFSRRSGPFWQKVGFSLADRALMAAALADTHQVRLFVATGQLDREVAWSTPLPVVAPVAH